MRTQARLKMNSTIHRAVGFSEEKEARFWKVAMAKKPVRKKMTREEMRRDCRRARVLGQRIFEAGGVRDRGRRVDVGVAAVGRGIAARRRRTKLTQSDMGVPSSANWKPTNPFKRRHQNVAQVRPVWIAANHCQSSVAKGQHQVSAEDTPHRPKLTA